MSLVTAIFVLLLLSGVAAYVASLSGSQQAASAMDLIGVRVYQAARSGAEWGVWNALKGSAYCAAGTDTQTLAAGAMPGGLAGFAVTVACTTSSHAEAGAAVQFYNVTATACNQGSTCPAASPGANYVERQVTMTVWK
jgi:MSHA biogenesis protein MshP